MYRFLPTNRKPEHFLGPSITNFVSGGGELNPAPRRKLKAGASRLLTSDRTYHLHGLSQTRFLPQAPPCTDFDRPFGRPAFHLKRSLSGRQEGSVPDRLTPKGRRICDALLTAILFTRSR